MWAVFLPILAPSKVFQFSHYVNCEYRT